MARIPTRIPTKDVKGFSPKAQEQIKQQTKPQSSTPPQQSSSSSSEKSQQRSETVGQKISDIASRVGQNFLEGAVGKTIAGTMISKPNAGVADAKESGKQTASTGDSGKDTVIAIRDIQSDLNSQTAVIKQTNDIISSQSAMMAEGFNGLTRNISQTNTLLQKILLREGTNGLNGNNPLGIPDIPDLERRKPGVTPEKPTTKPGGAPEKPKPVYNEKTGRFHEPSEPGKPSGKMVSNAEAAARGATKAETAIGDAAKGASKWSKFLTFLERKSPALFKKVGFKIASAAAGLAIPGPGWIWTAVNILGSLSTAWEIYELYQEFAGKSAEGSEEKKPAAKAESKPDTIDTGAPKPGAPIYDAMGNFTGMNEPDTPRPDAGAGRGSVIEAPGARAAAALKTKSSNEQKIDSIEKDHADSDELIKSFAAQMGLPLGAKYTAELRGGIPITINGKPVPRELYTEEQAKRVDAALAMAKLMQDPSGGGQSASPVTKSPVNAITSADGGSDAPGARAAAAPKTKSLNDQQIDSIKKHDALIKSFAAQMGLPLGAKYTAELRGGIPITINGKPVPRELYTEEQAKLIDQEDPSGGGQSASPVTKSPVNAITSADGGSGSNGDATSGGEKIRAAKTAEMADLDRKEENRRSELKDGDKESIIYSAKEMIFKAEKIAFNVQELKFETKAGQPSAAGTPTGQPSAAGTPTGQPSAAGTPTGQADTAAVPKGSAIPGEFKAPGATPATGAPAGGLKGGTFNEQAPEVMNKLMKDFNLTKEQAAGIVGNLGHESGGLQAGIQEKGMKSGRGGLGWAQWTGTRRTAFEKYLKETGQEASDPNANYGFLKKELETTHKGALKAVKNSTDTRGSMVAFEKHYEAAGVKHFESRQQYADAAAKMDLSAGSRGGDAATQPRPQQVAAQPAAASDAGAAQRSAAREASAPSAGTATGPSSTAAGASIERGSLGGNGMIPASNLTPIGAGHKLQASAAAAYMKMVDAAKSEGISWGISDSYRDYNTQVRLAQQKGLYSQGGLAARPGTSNHGWGLATDLKLNPKAQQWMQQHAGEYGFSTIPREPWHWEFKGGGKGGKGGAPAGGDKTKIAGEGAPGGGAPMGSVGGPSGSMMERQQAMGGPPISPGGLAGGNPLGMIGGMLGGQLGGIAGNILGNMFSGQGQIGSMAASKEAAKMTTPQSSGSTVNNMYTTPAEDKSTSSNKVDCAMPPAQIFSELFGIGLGAKGSTNMAG